MKDINFGEASMIIESIYESEIPCRIEWMYDLGFTWSVQNSDYPRLWKDEQIEGNQKIVCESVENSLLRNNSLLEKDWIARGSNYSFTEAIRELADKICELFPESKLAKWYMVTNREKY